MVLLLFFIVVYVFVIVVVCCCVMLRIGDFNLISASSAKSVLTASAVRSMNSVVMFMLIFLGDC